MRQVKSNNLSLDFDIVKGNKTMFYLDKLQVDGSGKLGFTEFLYLWKLLQSWKVSTHKSGQLKLAVVNLTNEWLYELLLQRLFYQYDVDGSGMLSSFELRRVLGAAGFKVDNSTMKSLVWRYTDEQFNLSLDSYFICLGKLMKLFSKFWALTFRLFLLFF